MAKIASSKPYGSGKAKTPTKPTAKKEIEVASPVRTSPRRRKSEAAELSAAVEQSEVQLEQLKKSGGRGRKPSPPTFSASKNKSVKAKPKSPKTPGRGRRKSALEPVVFNSEPDQPETETSEAAVVEEEINPNEIDDMFKYVNHITATEEESYEDEEDEEEDYVESIRQKEREESNLMSKREENSPIFEEDMYEISGDNSEEDFEHETTPSDEEVAFHFDEEEIESSEGSNSEALNVEEYNDQFTYNSSNVRLRLAQYFQRQESALSSASSLKNQLWTRMKEFVIENVIPSAKELGEVTVEYTKKAIEQITKRLEKKEEEAVDVSDVSVYEGEPRIYEITEEEQVNEYEGEDDNDNEDNEMEVYGNHDSDSKRAKLMENQEEEDFEMAQNSFILNQTSQPVFNVQNQPNSNIQSQPSSNIQSQPSSLKSSYHSVPADETLLFTPQRQEPITPKVVYNEAMDSRLTEIVLFFAKCTRDTPISSIYEHLEEFFTLKGENSLNLTEKQLVSSVIKNFLTEEDESSAVPSMVPVYEPVVIPNESPKRIKVLSGSGIRFRAPKFTAEEEARLEELEKQRQKNLSMNNKMSTLSTPQQRNKIQRKLLAPETTAELIEAMPENRGKASSTRNKTDSVSSAIEDIISQKIKESKAREEAERLETEKLKARVAELERESRERATKEVLLQKQLEEQKKELEIEKAAAKEKLESLKAASVSKPSINFGKVEKKDSGIVPATSAVPAASVGFSFGKIDDEKPPSGFSFGETSKATTSESTGFKGFSFGAKADAVEEEPKREETKPAAPFATFSFGAPPPAKTEDSKKSEESKSPAAFASFSFGKKETSESASDSADKSKLNPNAPAFNFGAAVKTEDEVKPSFGFSFGNSSNAVEKTATEDAKPVFSFGAAKTETAETKGGFSFGSTVSGAVTSESKPANVFNFGGSTGSADKPTTSTPAFNFGSSSIEAGKKDGPSAPTFSFGVKPVNTEKPTFSFGTANEPSKTNVFGTSEPVKPVFGSSEPAKTNLFGSSEPAKTNVFGSSEPAKTNSTGAFGSFNFGSSPALSTALSPQPQTTANNSSNPFAALNSATNIFSSAAPLNSTGFSFGAPAAFPPVPSANAFSFPPISPSNAGAPIIPMNFGQPGGGGGNDQQSADMAFQTGARAISIPRRRRK